MSASRCLSRSRFNLFFAAWIAADTAFDSADNRGVVAIRRHASSTRHSAQLRNRMKRRKNSLLQQLWSEHLLFKRRRSAAARMFPVAVQHILASNFPLTYRFDRSHVDQATGSVVGITNT
jgi:hypothetical protein